MTFFFQDDFSHPEIKKSAGGSIKIYPEMEGTGSVQVSTATANIYRSSTSITSPTVTITDFIAHNQTGSYLQVTVPAAQEYDEDYRVEWEATLADGSLFYRTTPFSVVYQPWGESTVSADDLMAISTISGTLETIGQEQNDKTVAQVASQFGAHAHAMLDDWIRNRSLEDGRVRAGAILDRSRLHKIEAKLAVALAWGHVMTGDTDNDHATMLHDRWMNDAQNSFQALGNLRFDSSDDGAPDGTATSLGRSVIMKRVRG